MAPYRTLGIFLPLGLSSLAWAQTSEASRQPNVLLIYADDLGYGDLACYGALGVETPHIDRLAREGVRHTQAHASAATSTPSRYSLLTGQYAWRRPGTDVAAGNAGMIISPETYTLADLMHEAGYRTGAIGKWHLGLGSKTGEQDWNGRLDLSLRDLGFDYSYIMAATADRVPCVFIEGDSVAHYDPTAPIEVSYTKPFAGEPLGSTHPELLTTLRSSHGHDMAIVAGIGRIGYMRGGGRALWQDENIADSITSRAIRFIEERDERPFFLYLATNDIHVPRYPHSRFRGRSGMGLRGDAILQLDWTVGQILSTLDSLGMTDETLIILTSDNGGVLDDGYDDGAEALAGAHSATGGLRGGKYSAFEGGTRIPAIVRFPRLTPQGRTSTALLSQVDLMATLAQILGRELPEGSAPDSQPQASSWLHAEDDGTPARSYTIEQAANGTLSVRELRWKYIEPSTGPAIVPWGTGIETGYLATPRLYDLEADPTERTDVAKLYPAEVARLSEILRRERAL